MDATSVQWADKGLTVIKDLYINDYFASFAQLQAEFANQMTGLRVTFSGPALSFRIFGTAFSICSVIYFKQLIPGSPLIILGCSNFSLSLSSLQQALMFGMVIEKQVILRD